MNQINGDSEEVKEVESSNKASKNIEIASQNIEIALQHSPQRIPTPSFSPTLFHQEKMEHSKAQAYYVSSGGEELPQVKKEVDGIHQSQPIPPVPQMYVDVNGVYNEREQRTHVQNLFNPASNSYVIPHLPQQELMEGFPGKNTSLQYMGAPSTDDLRRDQIPPPVFVVTFNRMNDMLGKRGSYAPGGIPPPAQVEEPPRKQFMGGMGIQQPIPLTGLETGGQYYQHPQSGRFRPWSYNQSPVSVPTGAFGSSGNRLDSPNPSTVWKPHSPLPTVSQQGLSNPPIQEHQIEQKGCSMHTNPVLNTLRGVYLRCFIGSKIKTPLTKCAFTNEFWEWIFTLFPENANSNNRFTSNRVFLYFALHYERVRKEFIQWIEEHQENIRSLVKQNQLTVTLADFELYSSILVDVISEFGLRKMTIFDKDTFNNEHIVGENRFPPLPKLPRTHKCGMGGYCSTESNELSKYPQRAFLLQNFSLIFEKFNITSELMSPFELFATEEKMKFQRGEGSSEDNNSVNTFSLSGAKVDIINELNCLQDHMNSEINLLLDENRGENEKEKEFQDRIKQMMANIFTSVTLIVDTHLAD